MTPDLALDGLRLLVVEDETLVAMLLEDMLTDLGCVVVGLAGTVTQGVAIARSADLALDAAVLDVNIGGERVFPVADALMARHVPFVFVTGYGAGGLDVRYAGRPTLAKPFQLRTLAEALLRLSRR
jgi:CheY-like chemotaxis protein